MVIGRELRAAPTNSEPRMLFLHLKLKPKNISLVNLTAAPGVVKPSRVSPEGIQYEVISVAGESLWKGVVADPSERHFEFKHPAPAGKLNRKTIHVDEAEFSVRIPEFSAAKQIDFYLLKPAAAARPENSFVRKPIGSVMLPPKSSSPP